ncbi:hypothetical protein DZA35_01640 [Arcobacter sp. HD9-500m-PIT-SAG03]|nr:hypothetical protein DZA35_01640 [Arcobacter sp. HD9-500m-PIT-SAG03]
MYLRNTMKYTKDLSILYLENGEDDMEYLSSVLETLFLTMGISISLHKPVEFRNFFDTLKKCSTIICAQNKMKDELHSSQEINHNLEGLLDIVNQVAIISKTNLQRNITIVNNFFCQTSGYSKKERLNQNHNILRHQDVKIGKVWKGKLKDKNILEQYQESKRSDFSAREITKNLQIEIENSNKINLKKKKRYEY